MFTFLQQTQVTLGLELEGDGMRAPHVRHATHVLKWYACLTQPQDEHVHLDRLQPVQLVPPRLWMPLNNGFGQCLQIKLLVSIYSIPTWGSTTRYFRSEPTSFIDFFIFAIEKGQKF